MNDRIRRLGALGGALAMALGALPAAAATGTAERTTGSAILADPCLNPTAPLSVEQQRLSWHLAQNGNPDELQPESFATQLISGGGFDRFGPSFVHGLCSTTDFGQAKRIVERSGKELWKAATDRAQRKGKVRGTLPYSDDRPLYWTSQQAQAAIQQWMPRFQLSAQQRTALVTEFDKAARGMRDIDFPAGPGVRRMIVSGFDPYTLIGGERGSAQGAVGNNIRHGNPSGASALAIDGTTYRGKDGKPVRIESYLLPVDFPQFKAGYLEDTVGPFMRPGPRRVDASITVSQAGPNQFDLEQWNGRYHGTSLGNDDYAPCPEIGDAAQLAVDNPECNTQVVPKWGGPSGFQLRNPKQFTETTLPVKSMIEAGTGRNVPRPPGDGWEDKSEAFGVVWHTNYEEFPDCHTPKTITRNEPVPVEFPPPNPPVPPDPGACARSGGGGDYLSNESGYRNTLLRDRFGLRIPAGHIHTPDMQHFAEGNRYQPSDDTFDAWRKAIVAQTRNLVDVVAKTVS
ncbi:hypothetical protein [Sciscionella sediminilitoris]|uniref:hypothetical protein n=1 Tax=Sciscionella sediminilitoris TaxID=1445613 RepID=UPI00068F4540|nr:hypothetical protein [Sciscionella sp. SE31]